MIGYRAVKGSRQSGLEAVSPVTAQRHGAPMHAAANANIFTSIVKMPRTPCPNDSGKVCGWDMWRVRGWGPTRRQHSQVSLNDSSVKHLYHLLFKCGFNSSKQTPDTFQILLQIGSESPKESVSMTVVCARRSYREYCTVPGTASPSHCGFIYLGVIFRWNMIYLCMCAG